MDRAVVTHIDEGWELGFLLGVPWWEGILTKITKNCKKIANIYLFGQNKGGACQFLGKFQVVRGFSQFPPVGYTMGSMT